MLCGCECGSSSLPAPKPFDSFMPGPSTSARRPSRTYYLGNTADGCFVYWVDGKRSSTKKSVRCPRELEPGERMRLAGRTCMREGPSPERNLPVRCDKHILYVERDDRADAGAYRLAPEGE
jgi:hypothetical protein